MLGLLQSKVLIAVGAFLPYLTIASSGGHGEEHSGPPHLPSLVGLLTGSHGPAYDWINIIYAFLTAAFMCVVSMRVYAKRQMIPGKGQNVLEMLVESMYNFFYSILGKDARKYTPFLGTIFFYILINNLFGIVPLGHSPSTTVNVTASLSILVFLYAQYTGVQRLGIVGYMDHLAGQPRNIISWCLVPLMLPMHIIGELAKPFSLALRLFGNITGEDVLIAAFVGLGLTALWAMGVPSPVGLPLQLPFYFLGILLSTIQALVFTLLSTIYILMMLPHEEHH
ncbi:MAG: F0F1 ATP synthase subunit A [Candidatus Zixiibacteriota bacterium]